MNICYIDFWPGFDSNCNWFNLLFKDVFNDKQINFNSAKNDADIIFASSFGSERYNHNNTKAIKIFYTGENERPDLNFGDYSLSFDFDTYGGRNFRLPHWYLYINWWGEPNFPHARISMEMLNKKWNPEEIYSRENFCSIIIGNPVSNRIEITQKLSEYSPVHGYGRVFGKPYNGCKIELLQNYRWNICFENSIFEGYVTEKLLEAKVAGCVPIYYGPKTVSCDFNSSAFLNYNFIEKEDLFKLIKFYDKNKKSFSVLSSEPLFHKEPCLDNVIEFLRGIMKKYV